MTKLMHRMNALFADNEVFLKTRWSIPLFYYILEFMMFQQLMRFEQFLHSTPQSFWGVWWVSFVPQAYVPHLFLMILMFGTTLGAVFYWSRPARIITFLAIFQFQSYLVSLYGQEHDFYIPLFVSFFFIFLPDVWKGDNVAEELRKRTTLIFWSAQAYILLTYTMSGLYKVLGAFLQYRAGEANYFSPDAAALYVAYWQTQFERTTVLGPFIVEHYVLSSFALIGILYVLTVSIVVATRPRLQRLWGIALIAFHISTVVSIGIIFIYNVLFVTLFLLMSPFSPEKNDWRDILRDLPLIGFMVRRIL